jgi:hypothetical protein
MASFNDEASVEDEVFIAREDEELQGSPIDFHGEPCELSSQRLQDPLVKKFNNKYALGSSSSP